MNEWSDKTGIPATRFTAWLEVARSKLFDWRERYELD